MPVEVKPLDAPFGAKVTGVDIGVGLGDADFAVIEEAFERHSVLVFPEQNLDDTRQIAFSEKFGALERTVSTNTGGGTAVAVFSNVGADGEIIPTDSWRARFDTGNEMWHTDSSFKRVPAKASLLSGRVTPPAGGETEFCSMRVAFSDLPAARQKELDGLVAIHDFAYSRALVSPDLVTDKQRTETPPVPQAVVRRNPRHGAPSLYVGAHASHVVGRPVEESREMLRDLTAFCSAPERVYRHRWTQGDLVMWDNRCCLHRGRTWNKTKDRRTMHRTTVAGVGPTASLTEDGGAVVHSRV